MNSSGDLYIQLGVAREDFWRPYVDLAQHRTGAPWAYHYFAAQDAAIVRHEPLFQAIIESRNPRLIYNLWNLMQGLRGEEWAYDGEGQPSIWDNALKRSQTALEEMTTHSCMIDPERDKIKRRIDGSMLSFWQVANGQDPLSEILQIVADKRDEKLESAYAESRRRTGALFESMQSCCDLDVLLHFQVKATSFSDNVFLSPRHVGFVQGLNATVGQKVDFPDELEDQEADFWRNVHADIGERVVTLAGPTATRPRPMPPYPRPHKRQP